VTTGVMGITVQAKRLCEREGYRKRS